MAWVAWVVNVVASLIMIMSYTQLLVGVALHVLVDIWEQVRCSFKLPVRVRQRVDASDRFFAVCKLALAFTRGHVRANQEVDQALVHLVGCLLALALATRLACPRSPFTTSGRACASNGYPNVSLYLWLALWSSERAPYNHPPLFLIKTPLPSHTPPHFPPLIKKCDVREWPKNASTGISLLLSLAANPLISHFGSTPGLARVADPVVDRVLILSHRASIGYRIADW